jgi:hypothetical protein
MMNLLGAPTSSTYSAERLANGFHRTPPTDVRYVSIGRIPQPPTQGVSQSGCEFRFPMSTDIYLFHDIKVQLKVRLVTKGENSSAHETPGDGTEVAPVNNVLHSCISSVRLGINGVNGKYLTKYLNVLMHFPLSFSI